MMAKRKAYTLQEAIDDAVAAGAIEEAKEFRKSKDEDDLIYELCWILSETKIGLQTQSLQTWTLPGDDKTNSFVYYMVKVREILEIGPGELFVSMVDSMVQNPDEFSAVRGNISAPEDEAREAARELIQAARIKAKELVQAGRIYVWPKPKIKAQQILYLLGSASYYPLELVKGGIEYLYSYTLAPLAPRLFPSDDLTKRQVQEKSFLSWSLKKWIDAFKKKAQQDYFTEQGLRQFDRDMAAIQCVVKEHNKSNPVQQPQKGSAKKLAFGFEQIGDQLYINEHRWIGSSSHRTILRKLLIRPNEFIPCTELSESYVNSTERGSLPTIIWRLNKDLETARIIPGESKDGKPAYCITDR